MSSCSRPYFNSPVYFSKKCDEHTVVPLSIAIKRMSEIVVYRAKGRLRALDEAHVSVNREIVQLDGNVDKIVEQINAAIQVCKLEFPLLLCSPAVQASVFILIFRLILWPISMLCTISQAPPRPQSTLFLFSFPIFRADQFVDAYKIIL